MDDDNGSGPAEYNPFGDESWLHETDVPPEALQQALASSPPPVPSLDYGSQIPPAVLDARYPFAAWWRTISGQPPVGVTQIQAADLVAGPSQLEERVPSPVSGPRRPPGSAQSIRVSVPLDTASGSPPYLRDTMTVDSDISWTDFIDRLRARMGLIDGPVNLGFRIDAAGARSSGDFKILANTFNMREAFDEYISTNSRARKKRDLVIYNLTAEHDNRSHPDSSKGTKKKDGGKKSSKKKGKKKGKKGSKRKREASESSDSSDEASEASEHLAALRNASLNTPPEGREYDTINSKRRSIERARKERRTVPATESSTSSLPAAAPASHDVGDRLSDPSDDSVVFPTTTTLLSELNETRPDHNYPQYTQRLAELGFRYTVDFENFEPSLFTDQAGMPPGAVRSMLDWAHVLTRRARKGKGRAD
ncbi:uncharacterized protein C8Q71DRAFT_727767 [Rhodofomes roseus]|uniref:Uncharacterized protein n=1 Tax=Rhodofomes roseus TaxID=34475 RepID=A0ABQ8K062_9APHY|nr:uncharacterized protein C8Q71DRAFT_727767 [Rhodofomes roseus]KAH9830008.1 hypothetical protein C8Q71DRAFT_727767 [Rhodofomes roseus]